MPHELSHDDEQRWNGYYKALREWAEYLVGPRLRRRLDKSELAHDAWAEAWESREDFRGTTQAEWEAWLRTILRHKLLNALRFHGAKRRSQKLEVAIPDRDDQSWANVDAMFFGKGPEPLQKLEQEERMAQFIEAVAGLSAKDQTVLRLRLFEGMKLAEIAERLGEPQGTIASRVARAIGKLRELLDGNPE